MFSTTHHNWNCLKRRWLELTHPTCPTWLTEFFSLVSTQNFTSKAIKNNLKQNVDVATSIAQQYTIYFSEQADWSRNASDLYLGRGGAWFKSQLGYWLPNLRFPSFQFIVKYHPTTYVPQADLTNVIKYTTNKQTIYKPVSFSLRPRKATDSNTLPLHQAGCIIYHSSNMLS